MKSEVQDLAPIEQNLMAIGRGLPFHAEQAWIFSWDYILSHLNDHASNYGFNGEHDDETPCIKSVDSRSPKIAALMAAGRLEWLLRETRPSLSGRLSEQEVITLLDCYRVKSLARIVLTLSYLTSATTWALILNSMGPATLRRSSILFLT